MNTDQTTSSEQTHETNINPPKRGFEETYFPSQALSPIATHVGSAIIRPIDKGKLKSIALETVEKQSTQQIAMLRRQADLIMMQVREIEERIRIAAEIYRADMTFEPVIGNIYHLYEREQTAKRLLSMIAPQEWTSRTNPMPRFVATVRLNADRTWDVLLLGEAI